MHVEIPFDCTAVIELFDPMNSENKLNVAAGAYDFEYELAHSLRNQYTVDTPLKVIFEDEEAMKIIEENMPELLRVSLHMQIKSIREIKEIESGPMSEEVADIINAMFTS